MNSKHTGSSWNFSEALKSLRENNGYTQEQLAKSLHVTKATISHYELGASNPSIDMLIQIADIFDVSLDYLMGRTKTKTSFNFWQNSFVKGVNNKEILERISAMDPKYRKLIYEILICMESDSKLKR